MTATLLPPPADLPTTATTSVGEYPTYTAAQEAVDYLSDHGFPVQHATVIGTDLRLVETVTGRLTVARAALAGARGGAWFGLLFGAVLTLIVSGAWWLMMAAAVVGSAGWGAVVAAAGHASTRGRRDFTSRRHLAAGSYHLTVATEHAEHAQRLLLQHFWRTP